MQQGLLSGTIMKFILVPCHGILSRYSAESFIFFTLSMEFSRKHSNSYREKEPQGITLVVFLKIQYWASSSEISIILFIYLIQLSTCILMQRAAVANVSRRIIAAVFFLA